MRSLLIITLLLVTLLPACTTTRSDRGERVYFRHTHAYEKKLATLTLTESEAAQRFAQWARATHQPKYWRGCDLSAIVGDSFVFSGKEKAYASLNGYFVDGHTGAVTKRDEGRAYPPFSIH